MRVLHLISSGGMYGAEAVILNLLRELSVTGKHYGALAMFSHPDQPKPALHAAALRFGIEPERVHLLSCRGQLDRGVPKRLRELAEQDAIDVVHTHGYKADIYAAYAWGRTRPALVSTCHTWYDNDVALRVYGALDRWVLRRFDGVVAVSDEVRERLLAAKIRPDRIRMIQNGVATGPFSEVNAWYGGEPRNSRLRVGLVGRLAPEKGIAVFLEAAALVLKQRPELVFEVAGEGPERPALEGKLRELGLEGQVTLSGSKDDMPAFYANLDLLVSASRQEGLPVALLEGMASGLPVVATRVGAVPQIVVEGVTGLLVVPDAPEALAAAMERVLASPALRTQFGEAGRRRVAAEFSAQRMAADYLAAYEQAFQARGDLQPEAGRPRERRA